MLNMILIYFVCITLGTYLVSINTGTYLVTILASSLAYYLLDKWLGSFAQQCRHYKSPQRVEHRQHDTTPQRECDTHSTTFHAHDTQSEIQKRTKSERHNDQIHQSRNPHHALSSRWSPA